MPENCGFSYEYDENGNIIEEYEYISENSMELRYSYEYNDDNQLIRYNDNVSDPKRSYTYTYDDSGRVLSRSTYTYAPLGVELDNLLSVEYYEYSDNVLTEYDNNVVERDINNYPTSYDGAEKEAYNVNSTANKLHNQTVTKTLFPYNETTQKRNFNFIHDQNTDDIKQYRYGINTSDIAGCGWVATYNACLLLENPIAPEEIISEYEKSGIFLYGISGTHPLAVANFFKGKGYEVNIYFGDYDTCATKTGVNILIYEQGTIDHFVAVQHNGEQYMGYNVCSKNTDAVELGNSVSPITYPDSNSTTHEAKMLISITSLENAN